VQKKCSTLMRFSRIKTVKSKGALYEEKGAQGTDLHCPLSEEGRKKVLIEKVGRLSDIEEGPQKIAETSLGTRKL